MAAWIVLVTNCSTSNLDLNAVFTT